MLVCSRNIPLPTFITKQQGGFSLIEAMVATMIISIAFVGVFSLTTFSAKQIVNSQDRQKLQLVANQIFEIIEIDSDNIASYATNLATCTTPGSGEARKYILRPYEWCTRLNAELGAAQTSDVRTITVTASGSENIVTVTLTSKNGANKVILKRTYD
jgi:prepilin-type N-terminal cleavage/methylation domain-containing protein